MTVGLNPTKRKPVRFSSGISMRSKGHCPLANAGIGYNLIEHAHVPQGNKIVLKNYAVEPMTSYDSTNALVVTAGDSCSETPTSELTTKPSYLPSTSAIISNEVNVSPSSLPSTSPIISTEVTVSPNYSPVESSALKLTVSTPFVVFAGSYSVASIAFIALGLMVADAQSTCTEVIDVEIYTDANEIIHEEFKSGAFEVCPPEVSYVIRKFSKDCKHLIF